MSVRSCRALVLLVVVLLSVVSCGGAGGGEGSRPLPLPDPHPDPVTDAGATQPDAQPHQDRGTVGRPRSRRPSRL